MSTNDVAFLNTVAEMLANDDPDDSTRLRIRAIAERLGERGTAEGHLLALWKNARNIPVDPSTLTSAMQFGEALFTSAA